jgi:hypothetical protein
MGKTNLGGILMFVELLAAMAMLAPLGSMSAADQAAPAPAPAPAAPAAYNSTDTDLGTLLDNPATKAVLDKYIHDIISNEQISAARAMTLKGLQPYTGEALNDAVLAKIDADLAKVPAK